MLDTNVFVSGVFFGGLPGRILASWAAGDVSLVLSPAILAEYQRVSEELGAEYPERTGAFEPVLALLATSAIIVDAPPLPERVGTDPDDEKFLCRRARVAHAGDRDW